MSSKTITVRLEQELLDQVKAERDPKSWRDYLTRVIMADLGLGLTTPPVYSCRGCGSEIHGTCATYKHNAYDTIQCLVSGIMNSYQELAQVNLWPASWAKRLAFTSWEDYVNDGWLQRYVTIVGTHSTGTIVKWSRGRAPGLCKHCGAPVLTEGRKRGQYYVSTHHGSYHVGCCGLHPETLGPLVQAVTDMLAPIEMLLSHTGGGAPLSLAQVGAALGSIEIKEVD
jgi:hypothetical protein